METVNTVNVIEMRLDDNPPTILSVQSWKDVSPANKTAERAFRDILAEADESIDVDACVEDGYYCVGDYCVMLVHSTN